MATGLAHPPATTKSGYFCKYKINTINAINSRDGTRDGFLERRKLLLMESELSDFVEQLKDLNLQELALAGYRSAVIYLEKSSWVSLFKDYLFVTLVYKIFSEVLYELRGYGLCKTIRLLYQKVATTLFRMVLNSPFVKPRLDRKLDKEIKKIERDLIIGNEAVQDYYVLPEEGLSEEAALKELDKFQKLLCINSWQEGKVSGAVYHGGNELIHLQALAFEKYCVANQLHPDVFPAVRKMESEVVAMVLDMFHAPKDTGCGTTSSGGTESLLLTCLSAKTYAYKYRGITEPEMILPVTAHAGFDKASYYFGIKIRQADLDPVTFQVDLKEVRRLINRNTILLVGSAPNYPHGIMDDVEGLGKLGETYKIPVHIDCCLGSFVIAFMERAGFTIPPFDFRVPGVTSISCDTHKYGFAPKGSSVIMYRNPVLRACQYYVSETWRGGVYGSPTLAGSRPGALIVGCWATMVYFGKKGYTDSCKEIVSTARRVKRTIEKELPEVQIVGNPLCSLIAFKSDQLDIYEVGDKLSKTYGWHLSAVQKPPALHLAITKLSIKSIDELISNLKAVVNEIKANPNKQSANKGTTVMYGIAGSVKTPGVVDRAVVGFLDSLYKMKPSD